MNPEHWHAPVTRQHDSFDTDADGMSLYVTDCVSLCDRLT